MRTVQRDQGATITATATVVDAASGGGTLQPGNIPFVFTRSSPGVYQVRFDSRVVALGGSANPLTGGYLVLMLGVGAGVFSINVYSNTFAGVNGNFSVIVSLLDKRT